ncbi:MAG TPA: hypothetical protein VFL54_09945 [Gammaproteobacteria bacterium]|nr:hypothetical protein [Gammaproteobacteria bacterium]
MANGVRSYQPRIQVTLVKCVKEKNAQAERYVAANNRIDLTPFLSENGSVVTHKDITQPLGTFNITFADQVDRNGRDSRHADSVYGIVAPMDYVEIRMARSPVARREDYGQYLPVIMRGFVSQVRRSQMIGGDGKPVRSVIIEGQDFGKLLQIMQIFYERNYGLGQNLVTKFLLAQNYAVKFKSFTASDFMRAMIDQIVTPELEVLWQESALSSTIENPMRIRTDGSLTVDDGTVQPYVFQHYSGNLWGLMKQFADLNWNELFIRDDPDGVRLVYRPFPYKDIDGHWIKPGADPGSTRITLDDVGAMNVSRSDANVANYFWVDAPHYQAIGPSQNQDFAYSQKENYLMEDYPNNNPALYGIRKMEATTAQGPSGESTSGVDLDKEGQAKAIGNMWDWLAERRGRLKAYNKDNVMFEVGDMTLKGNAQVRPGTYLELDLGAFRPEYYAYAVTQTYVPLREFTTKVAVKRGTGYIQRSRLERSPYRAERGSGVYE